jgi:hypothetical protein
VLRFNGSESRRGLELGEQGDKLALAVRISFRKDRLKLISRRYVEFYRDLEPNKMDLSYIRNEIELRRRQI